MHVRRLCEMIRRNSREFQAGGRVLRLKQYIGADVKPPHIDAILDALAFNTRVEVLYIQNFEWVRIAATPSACVDVGPPSANPFRLHRTKQACR
jgi:hypothetical protein